MLALIRLILQIYIKINFITFKYLHVDLPYSNNARFGKRSSKIKNKQKKTLTKKKESY